VGAELFHVDRQTDTMKLVFTFHNFANMCTYNPQTRDETQKPGWYCSTSSYQRQ